MSSSRRRGMLVSMAKPLSKLLSILKPKRRWFQFRLLTLFAIITAFCVPLAWVGVRMHYKRREQSAVTQIEKSGGRVFYDWKLPARGSRQAVRGFTS